MVSYPSKNCARSLVYPAVDTMLAEGSFDPRTAGGAGSAGL